MRGIIEHEIAMCNWKKIGFQIPVFFCALNVHILTMNDGKTDILAYKVFTLHNSY